jgi:hypothetical protein
VLVKSRIRALVVGVRIHRWCRAVVVTLDSAHGSGRWCCNAGSQRWIHARLRSRSSITRLVVSVGQTLLQHAVIVSHDSSQFGVEVKKCVMLAHRLSICPCQLRSQRPNTLVQLLKLRFTQDGPGWLVLQTIDQSRE